MIYLIWHSRLDARDGIQQDM
uniref:Uncharacterized protein n=1 Tax=Arundo donax TaxID=35708 RepID=A0A0A8YTS2_ARUDO